MATNPLKIDPTRTTLLRRAFRAEMRRRFRRLKKLVVDFIAKNDTLGLGPRPTFKLNVDEPRKYEFLTDDAKLTTFNAWFKEQIDANLLTLLPGDTQWTAKYIESAYRKGIVRAFTDAGPAVSTANKQGAQNEFLRVAFASPERVSKLKMLASRSFQDLEAITAKMEADMNRILANGIAHGDAPKKIAKEMAETIDGLVRKRADVIAQTEIIHAHAEGQLDGLEDLGVQMVGAEVEWSTAGDDRVCPECAAMEGKEFTIDDARGLIPLHPRCRCGWTPVDQTKDEPKLKQNSEHKLFRIRIETRKTWASHLRNAHTGEGESLASRLMRGARRGRALRRCEKVVRLQ